MNRRAFLGWAGLTSYGAWALLRPAPKAKPPKPTTTLAATTTTMPTSGSKWPATWPARW